MAFVRDFTVDPYADRVYLLIFGAQKIGKTHLLLDLVRNHGQALILFDVDRGAFEVRKDPKSFRGRLVKSDAMSLRDLRKDLRGAIPIVEKAARKLGRENTWIAFDTVTQAQTKLISEARMVNVKNPDARDPRDEFIRDAVIEVDWNINLGHMSELADALLDMRCNVVVTAHSRSEKSGRKETGRNIPALSGQSYNRFLGDADALLELNSFKDGERYLSPFIFGSDVGGDRSGNLTDPSYPADLTFIRKTMLGLPTVEGEDEPKSNAQGARASSKDEADQASA
jgi:hypothetical protein